MEEDNKSHLERFKQPPHPSYISGFIDGDGCIFIRKISDGYQSGFTISQSRTNILQIIRYFFGGSITSCSTRNNNTVNVMDKDNFYYKYNTRNEFNLMIRNNEYQLLLEYLYGSFIIKENQYKCLYEFNKIANLQNKNEEKEKLYLECSSLNQKCTLNNIYLNRLNDEYISGLFDAEGCFYIHNKFEHITITISQKNHPSILYEIVRYLGFGKVVDSIFTIYKKKSCQTFINIVKKHLIVKYNQAVAFEKYLLTNDRKTKEEMYSICNKEKHEIEIFSDLNQNNNGKEYFNETLKLRNMKDQICKEIHIKNVYKEKSEKMKGEGNHNFGKTFSNETKQKMSISIRNAKQSVSDELIMKVRESFKEGHKNVEIEKMYDLPRHTVLRIKNNQIVCRTEEKIYQKPLTQIESNLVKRKITTEDILITIEKYIDKLKPMQILDHFIEYKNKNGLQHSITIDIIKQIKQKLINGKTIIYEQELNKEKYDYYKSLLQKYKETNIII
jgi:hypothetical protein